MFVLQTRCRDLQRSAGKEVSSSQQLDLGLGQYVAGEAVEKQVSSELADCT